jgi:ribosomal protein L21
MYAIVETGGKQYRVKPGDTVAVEKLAGEPGEMLDLDRVPLIAGAATARPALARLELQVRSSAPRYSPIFAVTRSSSFAKSKVRHRRKIGQHRTR